MSKVTLYQFPVSHFCEKVRWALDYKNVSHTCENLVPLAHVPRMLWLSGQTQVPVLVWGQDKVKGSTDILLDLEGRQPARPLFPTDPSDRERVEAEMRSLDRLLGADVRRICYFHILDSRSATISLLGRHQSPTRLRLLSLAYPGLKRAMQAAMRIDEEGYQRSLDRLTRVLQQYDERVYDRPYLAADRFTAADLTFAALLAPLAGPEGSVYDDPVLPDPFRALCERLAQHASLKQVHRLYREFRQDPAEG